MGHWYQDGEKMQYLSHFLSGVTTTAFRDKHRKLRTHQEMQIENATTIKLTYKEAGFSQSQALIR